MATLVKYTTHESEVRILYEYLAEASVVFPKVFPVIHSLLDAKITNVLSLCHDKTILAAVQSIIENMIACEDEKSQQQLHFLQVSDFFGDMYNSDIVRRPQFFLKYRNSSYSFRGNYSFLDLEIQRSQYIRPKATVHKGAETIQGRKLFKGGNYIRKYGKNQKL